MAGTIYGGLCALETLWSCMDTSYGLSVQPRPAYMTTLSHQVTSLHYGDFAHSCRLNPDSSMSCMMHGGLVPPCDIATLGTACHVQPPLYRGEITPNRPDLGVWTLIPNLAVLAPSRPQMFGRITDLAKAGTSRTHIAVSWTPKAHSTHHRMKICDPNNLCTTLQTEPYVNGEHTLGASFENLRPNTCYVISVQGYNWASDQGPPATVSIMTRP
jgi:hypothetical protein